MHSPITDRSLGVPKRAFDAAGYAEVRHKAGLPVEEPRHQGHRKRVGPLTAADFPIGRQVVCEATESRTGRRSRFLCQVVDAYESRFGWKTSRVYVAVLKASDADHADLVGHICPVSIERGHWSLRDMTVTDDRPERF